MTFEQIKAVNNRINKVDIKGKAYAQVNDRVMAFRELYPEGGIHTELLSNIDGVCVVQASVCDDQGRILATGLAYEKENSSYINKTSYIENCETSAVGRALGFLGIGADENICSAEELVNAVTNQSRETPEEMGERLLSKPSEKQIGFMNNLWKDAPEDVKASLKERYDFDNLTRADATAIIGELKK